MNKHPKVEFFPLCDLHHSPMRRVMVEESASDETGSSFHQCQRRDCNRIFRDGHGYTDFANGQFDASRTSARECSICGGTLYLAEVDNTRKVETWECAELACDFTEELASPSSR